MRLRWMGTAAVAAFVWALLAWEYTHGGVVTHRIMARDDLPGLSNAWGGVLLPALAWFLLGRMQRRLGAGRDARHRSGRAMLAAFIGAAAYGAAIAYTFTRGPAEAPGVLAQALPVIALLLPIYRAEYVLGFVLAMAYTFGGILPVAFACVVALLAFVIHHCARWTLRVLGARIGRRPRASAHSLH
ncbi:hypothetical protein [Cognatilysobacter tabacisoli]|uniref:hypothetical protein n=1 Tax=Cognatilysobacter tabacisoli TaxID=2315424 RepID=UPI000E6AF5BF|nr:hypothetical protein [Lysobacter tabacisoli]